MNAASDPVIAALDAVVAQGAVAAIVKESLGRVLRQLERSTDTMAWETIPLSAFGSLPESIRSCWIFVIRADAETGAERHPNSHQRSLSLTGTGRFELRERDTWGAHQLVSTEGRPAQQRWVTIAPSTWHRLLVDSQPWGMLSFHTVAAEELIEEKPVDPLNLGGATHQERYAAKTWQPYREPLRVTLLRTVFIGLVVGLVVALLQRRPASWPQWTAFALWFTFGGHWVELFFLNWLRPRLAAARWAQIGGRLLTWLVGGTLLMAGARITVWSLPPWWLGGPVFVGLELLVHALAQLRGQPSFYNGLL